MKKIHGVIAITPIILILVGCATGEWESIPYSSPGSTINLKSDSKIKIIGLNQKNEQLNSLVNSLTQTFINSRKVIVDEKNPDYILVLDLQRDYRSDSPTQMKFNTKYSKKSIDSQSGGHDELEEIKQVSSTNATFVSVVLYQVKNLSPEYSFEILLYDSELSRYASKTRGADQYNSQFTSEIIAKLKDALLIQYRKIDTYLPKNADKTMYEALTYLTNDNIATFRQREREVLPSNFDEFITDVQAGKYKDKEDELEATLSNFYLAAIFNEISDFKPENLQAIFARQLKIMQVTNNDALIIGCANSLGRIESKWRTLQNTDIGGNL